MAYSKQTWVDEVPSANSNKFTVVHDGGTLANATITPVQAPQTAGSPLNATRMNTIEDGLEAAAAVADNAHSDAAAAQTLAEQGWMPAPTSWTYGNTQTIMGVGANASTYYRVGDRIKCTDNGTTKYFFITNVYSSYVSVHGDVSKLVGTYTNPIADGYISRMVQPEGFPSFFNFSPTITWTDGTTPYTSVACPAGSCFWWMNGPITHFTIHLYWTTVGAGDYKTVSFKLFHLPAHYSPVSAIETAVTSAGAWCRAEVLSADTTVRVKLPSKAVNQYGAIYVSGSYI